MADPRAATDTRTDTPTDTKWWTLAAVCAGVFMLLLDVTIVNVALPDIQGELDASLSDLQWVIDAYALSLAALLLTAGSLADLYGRRKVYVIGLVLFTLGSVLCGSAQTITLLSVARAFQGVGGAAMFATSLALLAGAFTGKDRGVAFGVFGATTGVAVAVGPVLGGVLTSGLSWRWIFFVNIPICAIAIAMTVLKVKESRDPHAGRPDWIGFVVFTLGLAALVYGLIEAGQDGFGATKVIVCLVAAVVLLALFVVSQRVQERPMFDLALLRKPTFVGGLIAAFAVSSSIFALLAYLVIYVQDVLDYSAVATGVRFLFLSGAAFIAASIAGRLTEHMPVKWLIGPGFLLLGVGLVLMLGIQDDSSWTHLIAGLTVAGFAIGMITAPLASTAVGVVAPERSGMASGINSTFRQVGIATGIAALGSIFGNRITDAAGPKLEGKVPAQALDGLVAALSGGQVKAAAAGAEKAAAQGGDAAAGKQAYELVNSVGTSAVVDALNHILLIGAVIAFVAGVACLVLIRQQDFVARDDPQPEDSPEAGTPPAPGRHLDVDAEPDTGPGPDPDAHHNVGPHGGAHESGAHLGEAPTEPANP